MRILIAVALMGCRGDTTGPEATPIARTEQVAAQQRRDALVTDAFEPSRNDIDTATRSGRGALALEAKLATDQQAGREMRAAFVDEFEREDSDESLGFRVSLGDDDRDLVVTVTNGKCSERLLRKMIELAGEPMRNAKFRRLRCAGTTIETDL